MRKGTKALALAAMLAAAEIAVLLLASFVPSGRLALAALAGTANFIALIECGRRWSLLAYAAVSLIGVLLLPMKAPAVLYAAFFGYYPIVKSLLERMGRRRLEWPLKLLLALASMAAVLLVYKTGFLGGAELPYTAVWAVFAAGLAGFAVYDILLSKLIETYIKRKMNKR